MTILTALVMIAAPASACTEEASRAEVALREAKSERREAFRAVHSTNWDYYLSMGDRDQTLAEMDAAEKRLHDARSAVRVARQDRALIASSKARCTPAEIEAAQAATPSDASKSPSL